MFERLIKLVRQGKVSLFIGSGFSFEAHAPSVSDLKELILNEFDNDKLKEEHRNDGLAELTEYFVEEVCAGSRNELIGIMKKAFDFEPVCMDDHKLLASIPHFKTLFTTNYDTLLEDSYPECERRVIRNDEDCTYDENKRVSIYKLHGDFTSPDSVVITTSDYKKYFTLSPEKFITDFLKKYILQHTNDAIEFDEELPEICSWAKDCKYWDELAYTLICERIQQNIEFKLASKFEPCEEMNTITLKQNNEELS